MYPRLSVLSLALFAIVVPFYPCITSTGVNPEKEAVLEVLHQYVEAYNRRDAEALTALFDKDADIVTTVSACRSLEQIEIFFKTSMARGGTIREPSLQTRSLRFLRPDVAILDVSWETTGIRTHDGKQMPPLHRTGTFLLVKNRGGWVFSAMRPRTFTISKPKF
jgi:uncharacterized protein (TIGR02246 family)